MEPEPQRPDRSNQRYVKKPDQEKRERLPENEFRWADGRDHDLLERADLAFTDHGEGCQRSNQYKRETCR